ncbi:MULTISPECIES: polysaccharide deacetylase family protein [unclassified Ensifer]|uniref:polysaccharide deacetylase family protein n=1 Tax=unclassified Ensifer TaxID=2633371 RepID=UPI00070DE3F9|nr:MULTISPECIES: polysaccharide deacetylase family protein [unclassified Ensifer]KQW33601.1 polysaccharide deacetylase [Ensifer sp. Root1252]KRC78775.1 polysaccharide deacetylase [Ensifer sp. Root231]KRD02678.1 polysaccharide deacetylase [Ensifer sp. Root258]
MTVDADWHLLVDELDRAHVRGRKVDFWLRDDDATEPSAPLDRLLSLAASHAVPVTLAVPPAPATEALARRLAGLADVCVTVHGWAHRNHAPPGEKKQELGAHRPHVMILDELRCGVERLQTLFPEHFIPMLVPPWNRIDPALLQRLPEAGFAALSVFGPEKPSPFPLVNTHVDVMDWRGTRGCRDHGIIIADIVSRTRQVSGDIEGKEHQSGRTVGLLTHHLVHDEAVWDFLEKLFTVTAGHPGCQWRQAKDIIDR